MPNTSNQSLPYPSLGEAANGPAAVQSLALAVEGKLVQVFASATERSTKLTAPTEGMACYLRDVDRFEVYSGSSWGVANLAVSEATYLKHTAGAAKRIHRQDYIGGTTDASGFLTITHTAGFTPTFAMAFSRSPATTFANSWGSDTYTATQTRLRFNNVSTGGVYASGSTGAFTVIFWE